MSFYAPLALDFLIEYKLNLLNSRWPNIDKEIKYYPPSFSVITGFFFRLGLTGGTTFGLPREGFEGTDAPELPYQQRFFLI